MFVQYNKTVREKIQEVLKTQEMVLITESNHKRFVVHEDLNKVGFLRLHKLEIYTKKFRYKITEGVNGLYLSQNYYRSNKVIRKEFYNLSNQTIYLGQEKVSTMPDTIQKTIKFIMNKVKQLEKIVDVPINKEVVQNSNQLIIELEKNLSELLDEPIKGYKKKQLKRILKDIEKMKKSISQLV